MRRFFVEKIESGTALITGGEVHHLKNVLRKNVGDLVFLFDGKGNEYKTEILEINPDSVKVKIILKLRENVEAKIKVNLYQSVPKRKKFDLIVEKTTELGVNTIIPVISERTIPEMAERCVTKLSRWQKIAIAASKQCGRTIVPKVLQVLKFADVVKSINSIEPVATKVETISTSYIIMNSVTEKQSKEKSEKKPPDLKNSISLILWEYEKENTLKNVLKSLDRSAIQSINLLVGPEGGFSDSEIELAKKNNIISVSIGKRIFRAETAPMAAVANILYELED
ncbi:MAG: 16S rRNA (uracil(1498)-N(3))-methyltransferase [Elusimicrobia bacterium]|nr:16S rRNA (uracil(1498)-N(3))-methyltransferase [Elusimicrobiota bacterium]